MESDRAGPSASAGGMSGVPRRAFVQGLLAAGVAAGTMPVWASGATARAKNQTVDWQEFDRLVESAFDRMRLVGAAVAVVSADRVLHTATFGDRSLAPRRSVTRNTRFRVGSTTKSMTAALLATYVDEGLLGWDQPVIDAWSGFRAPTDELTRALRVRDLVGMASGLGEPPSTSLRFGGPTTAQLLQSVVNLPVINQPGQEFYYNNTVYAVGGYLPFLASGIAPADLRPAYTQAMFDRLFAPAGMTGAQIADDPRGLVADYATGNQFDLRPKATTLPFGPIGSHTPAGGALAGLRDMAAWVRLQLRQGVSVNGGQVVSAANLAECWKPHVTTPAPGELDPDYASAGYAMGWLREEYKDSSSLIWHNGAIDGFASFIGFLPQHDVGLVVLNSMTAAPIGTLFYTYVLNLLLSEQLGLNVGVPDKVLAETASAFDELRQLGRQAEPVDADAMAPFLGYYEGGYSLVREGRDLQLRISSRVMPLEVMPDGSYVMSGGFMVGVPVNLAIESDGVPHVEIVGLETVRRTIG